MIKDLFKFNFCLGIVNGARGFIDSIQASKEDPDVAEVIWVRFTDDKIGQLLRMDSKALLNEHKPKDSRAVPITRQRKRFKIGGNSEYMREQFPLTLCYAVTSHKRLMLSICLCSIILVLSKEKIKILIYL